MWEVLLSACLLTDPAQCRADRLPGGDSYETCRAEADRLSRAAFGPEWLAQDWPCAPAGQTPGFPVTEVAPGVWVHKGAHGEPDPSNRGDLANLGFVIGREAVAVIDAGSTPEIAAQLLAAIRARTDLPARWLVLTHMHPDHALGAGVFREAGATVIGHAKLGPALGARFEGYRAAMARSLGIDPAGWTPVDPDETVATPREIDLGDRVLRLLPQPVAHTDNDLVVEDAATGVRFVGDLLFLGHTPALDGSIRGWLRLTESFASETAAVVAGHGPALVWTPAAAMPQLGYLTRIAAEARAAIAAGRPMLGAVAEIGESQRDQWLLFDQFNQRNATAAFQELEWE